MADLDSSAAGKVGDALADAAKHLQRAVEVLAGAEEMAQGVDSTRQQERITALARSTAALQARARDLGERWHNLQQRRDDYDIRRGEAYYAEHGYSETDEEG